MKNDPTQKRKEVRARAAEILASGDDSSKAKRRKNNLAEDAVLGVVSAGGNLVQGVSGLTAEAAKYSQKEAAMPPDKSVKYVNPPTSLGDIPRAVWETLNSSQGDGEKRVVETSRNMHRGIAKPVAAVGRVAEREYADAKKSTGEVESNLGTTGKVVSAVADAGIGAVNPALAVGMGVGKERSLKGGVIPAAAQLLTKGSSLASKTASQVGEYVAQKARESLLRGKEDPLVALRDKKKKQSKKA